MKVIIKNRRLNVAAFLLGLTAVFLFNGCSTAPQTKADNGNAVVINVNNNTVTVEKKDASSEFPMLPAAILQTELKSIDGSAFKLEDRKGKVVLVNFWATWCGPCKAEMPELVKLYEENKADGFDIIGVDSDTEETPEMIKTFGEKMNLTYQLATGTDEFFSEFLKISKFNGIPQSFLIDREGRLRGVYVGGGSKTVNKLKEDVVRIMGKA
jgi:thiol-disulfide isomerase/thioredoxin